MIELILLLVALVTPALAADGDVRPALLVERARVALERERPDEARELALQAARASADPEALALLVEASMAAGLGPWALAVPSLPEDEGDEGVSEREGARRTLLEALQRSDDAAALAAFRALADEERPDLAAVAWALPAPRKTAREASKLAKRVERRVPAETDPVWLYRARVLLLASGRPIDAVHQRLVEVGEPAPPSWAAPSRIELLEEARQQAARGQVALPELGPSALLFLVDRLAHDAGRARRHDVSRAAWEALLDRHPLPEGYLGLARARIAEGRHDDALAAVDEAMVRAVDPLPDDLAISALERRRLLLSEACHVRALALEGLGRLAEAQVEWMVAGRLAGAPVDEALGRRLQRKVIPADGPPVERILAGASASADPVAAASQALVRMASAPSAAWRGDLVEAHRLLGRHLQGAPARIAWTLAILLADESVAADHRALAALHEAEGHTDAAFRHHALAGALDTPDNAALVRTWRGLSPPDDRRERDAVVEVLTADLRDLRRRRESHRQAVVASRAHKPSTSPPLPTVQAGHPAPEWSFSNDAGMVSSRTTKGRVVVLTFFTVDCVECLGMLHDLSSVARTLRAQGRDVVVLGISTDGDEQQERFEHVKRVGQRWGELYRDPGSVETWGAGALPLAWVFDTRGVAREEIRRWLGRAYLERQVRRAFQEHGESVPR